MFIEFYSDRDDIISEVYLVAATARLILLENAYAGFALIKLWFASSFWAKQKEK